jgi:hypothetical protein
VEKEFGYIPDGLQSLSSFFSAPFKDYNVPLPFFDGADAPLLHTALGYEITGVLGMLLIGLIFWGLGAWLLRRQPDSVARPSAAS